jgi:hypothetical protein
MKRKSTVMGTARMTTTTVLLPVDAVTVLLGNVFTMAIRHTITENEFE